MEAAAGFFRDLLAPGRAESTVRSYAYDLLRWLRFLDAEGVSWDGATRVDARDFSRWLQVGGRRPAGLRRREMADANSPSWWSRLLMPVTCCLGTRHGRYAARRLSGPDGRSPGAGV